MRVNSRQGVLRNNYRIVNGHVVEMVRCDWLFTVGYIIIVAIIY